ncbi:MAG: STN domain-containing protein, partial [Pseudomonadota bacterium]
MRQRSAKSTIVTVAGLLRRPQEAAVGMLLAAIIGASASAQTSVPIDIPAQPLATALEAYSNATGISVVYAPETAAGLRSSPVGGSLTPQDALDRLTAGTGVVATFVGDSTVRVERVSQVAEASEVILLDQILVEGELLTRTLQDSQTSVAVITGEELEQRSDP